MHVVVLAPMPHEAEAIVAAFDLAPAGDAQGVPFTGRVGNCDVTAIHIGMGPAVTRAATARLFDETQPGHRAVDHVMIAGICGGLDPNLEVGTVINPEIIVEASSGATYRHRPPGDVPQAGKLITTETVASDVDEQMRWFEDGFVGVDMESSAVAEVCEAHRCPWSVYRCIGDRHFDGLLDPRIIAMTKPDGSGDFDAIARLLSAEPDLAAKLERLAADTVLAAQRAAQAAVRGCLALGS